MVDEPTKVPPPAAPAGTGLDEAQSDPVTKLPPPAAPVGTEIDESQVFDPRGE